METTIPDLDAIFHSPAEPSLPFKKVFWDRGEPSTSLHTLQQILPAHFQVAASSVETHFPDLFGHPPQSHYPFIGSSTAGDNGAGPSIPKSLKSNEPSRASADDYSDLLIAPDRQAELMADP